MTKRGGGSPDAASGWSDRAQALATLLLLAAAVWAVYGWRLDAPFIFDDSLAIVGNDSIRRLRPLVGDAGGRGPLNPDIDLPVSGRPLANLSLALNYRLGGLDPLGYRIVNLLLHTLSAWTLWALARRALRRGASGPEAAAAAGPALAIALLWAVHPLVTEAVFYVTQRTELLVGLFYLAALYAGVRYWEAGAAPPRAAWLAAAALACLAGAACKEIIVTAPLVAALFHFTLYRDRPLGRYWPLYPALAASWALTLALQWDAPHRMSSGFGLGVPLLQWWLTQAGIMLMYFKLAVFPWPLLIHYELPWADPPAIAWAHAAVVAALALVALALLARRRPAGMLLASAMVILAPTHAVPMLTEIAAERRMYLPLAALVALAVVGARALLRRVAARPAPAGASGRDARALHVAAAAAVAALAAAWAVAGAARVAVLADPMRLWSEIVAVQPHNYRAQHTLGVELATAGRLAEAGDRFRLALAARPDFAQSHYGLGMVLLHTGALTEAIGHLETAALLDPGSARYRRSLGEALLTAGRYTEAVTELERAFALAAPDDDAVRASLAEARRRAAAR